MTSNQINLRFRKLGLISDENEPVLYSRFKNRATIHTYKAGRGVRKVVFIGVPNQNIFGFYSPFIGSTDSEIMKEAYTRYVRLVNGELSDLQVGHVQWGNGSFPETYSNLVKI